MKGALFKNSNSPLQHDDFENEVAKEIELVKRDASMVWESAETPAGPEVIHTRNNGAPDALKISFIEDPAVRAQVIKLCNKARRAQFVHYRYNYAVKCYVKALEQLTAAKYPEAHPTIVKTLASLNNAHHALSSYKNSANIVKMGIKYEDNGEWVRALKMYTIAYRIRRDNLSRTHPSLIVLLNMLGSIQIKRGEHDEAMQIFDLALKDTPPTSTSEDLEELPGPAGKNLLARSVTYREMGIIHEKWGELEEALNMYHRSLDCVAEHKGLDDARGNLLNENIGVGMDETQASDAGDQILLDLENVRLSKSFTSRIDTMNGDDGGMELFIGSEKRGRSRRATLMKTSSAYDSFFPTSLEDKPKKKKNAKTEEKRGDFSDVDVALTLHQIAQLHRISGEFSLALAAYNVSLRGMKHALGKNHPNVAAILGNIGNLQKETGDLDGSFETYQQVLGIESYRLGLSHPDVAITLHNIATIDAARGNHEHSLALYRQVLSLQRKLFGDDHVSAAVTSACMGDVYERIGDLKNATDCYEEAVRVKTAVMGRHSLEVARLLHKLGKLSLSRADYHLSDSYISRAILIYRLNKLAEEDEWVVDAYRDAADIDAAIAMGRGSTFEC